MSILNSCRNRAAICVTVVITILCAVSGRLYAENMMDIKDAKAAMESKLAALGSESSDKIYLGHSALGDILARFSDQKFTFGELELEFLLISKRLNKDIVIRDGARVFNKFKDNMAQRYPLFDLLEYQGGRDRILIKTTPDSDDGRFHIEEINGRNVYHKEEIRINVSTIYDRNVRLRTGVFSSDKVHVRRGISLRYREGDVGVDSRSVLGILSKDETIVVLDGESNGNQVEKGCFLQVLGKKYGGIDHAGDFIKNR